MATIRGSKERTPSAMPGAMPKKANQAAATELHSIKCPFTEANQSVQADATEAKNSAAAINIQYRLSNFTPRSFRAGPISDYQEMGSSDESSSLILLMQCKREGGLSCTRRKESFRQAGGEDIPGLTLRQLLPGTRFMH
jgi:hypothetical protein